MYGLEAINAHDGWSIAILGAGIVFSGLVILCIAISQLHKLLLLWETRKKFLPSNNKKHPADTETPDHFSGDINEVAKLYGPVFAKLGESFQLSELYKISQNYGFPHPHLTIKKFRQAQILISLGDGRFELNNQTE